VLLCVAVCCIVAVCCSVLQYVAVCCSVLQCVLQRDGVMSLHCSDLPPLAGDMNVAVCCSVLQCVAVCCSVMQCDAVCCSVLQCVAACCSMRQCMLHLVDSCCSIMGSSQYLLVVSMLQCVLQYVAICYSVCCSVLQSVAVCVAVCCNLLRCVLQRGGSMSFCRGFLSALVDGMGWLRLVGSLKLQISFSEYSLFYRALLQRDL